MQQVSVSPLFLQEGERCCSRGGGALLFRVLLLFLCPKQRTWTHPKAEVGEGQTVWADQNTRSIHPGSVLGRVVTATVSCQDSWVHKVCPTDLCPNFLAMKKKETQRLARIICCQRRSVFWVLHRLPKWKLGLWGRRGAPPRICKDAPSQRKLGSHHGGSEALRAWSQECPRVIANSVRSIRRPQCLPLPLHNSEDSLE